jgi:hypothetical protein
MLETRIMMYLPGCSLMRLCLLIVSALFTLAGAAHSEATPSGLQQSTDSTFRVTEAGAETVGGISRVPGPVSDSGLRVAEAARKDLTGFFVIGIIINVLLITLFLIWAVGQWRKTKK